MSRMVGNRTPDSPKPVQKIALSERFPKWRLCAVIFFVAIGALAFAYSLMAYFRVDSGWQAIEVSSSAQTNCSSEFSFQYNLGAGQLSSTAEHKAIVALYTQLTVNAHQLFHPTQTFDGVHNICFINAHPNEIIDVDPVLYRAFEVLQRHQSRLLYLGPIYAEYENLFSCKDDSETVSYDPYQSSEVAQYFAQIAAFANNPSDISLELLGDNSIRLYISENYLAYAQEIGFVRFLDFFSIKNAFVIDYLADSLIAHQYTEGHLTSYDGFMRTLGTNQTVYTYQLYDRNEQHIYPAAVMQCQGPICIVSLRDYPLNSMEQFRYYELANKEIRFPYIDSVDGWCKSAVHTLTGYAKQNSCSDIVVQLLPIYTTENLSESQLALLRENDIYTIYGKDYVLYYNEASLVLTDLYQKEDTAYRAVLW